VWQEEYKSLSAADQKKFTDWRYFWAYVGREGGKGREGKKKRRVLLLRITDHKDR